MRTRRLSSKSMMRQQMGAAAVELAIVMFVMLLIVAGTIGFGRTFWHADALTKATRDGARLLSTWPVASINSAGVSAAQDIAKNSANAASVQPKLTAANVIVECLNDAFGVVACADDTPPANVRVRITGFSFALSEWFPFVGTSGVIDHGTIGLSPHTTMRYMN